MWTLEERRFGVLLDQYPVDCLDIVKEDEECLRRLTIHEDASGCYPAEAERNLGLANTRAVPYHFRLGTNERPTAKEWYGKARARRGSS